MPAINFEGVDSYFGEYYPHILFYGYNGTGKTTIAAKTGFRTILIDCGDAGVTTLKKSKHKGSIRVVRVKSILHFLDVAAECVRLEKEGKVEVVQVDTLSGLRSMAIREVKGKKNFDMNIKKWGMVNSRMIECIHEIDNFPKDVIYLAQEKHAKKLGEDGPGFIMPSLPDGVREFMSGRVDWVGRIFVEDNKRKLSFILSDDMEAKDREGIFPKVLVLGDPEQSPYPKIRERIVNSFK